MLEKYTQTGLIQASEYQLTTLNSAYAFFSILLFLAVFLHLLFVRAGNDRSFFHPILILLSALVIMLLPIGDSPVFFYVRGYIGDLSITSSIFFTAYLMDRGFRRKVYQPVEIRILMSAVVILGLFIYPMALGLGSFDPYRLGYHPQTFLILLFCCAIFFWLKAYHFLLFVVTTVVIGFVSGLLESNNFWDYLLDAVLWLVFVSAFLLSGLRRFVGMHKP